MIPDADIVWDKREQSRIEAQIKKQQELKLIGRMKKVPGLKDKNGKKVYEADILTDKFGSMGGVEWRDGGFVVNFGDMDIFDLSDCFGDSYQMWVIGNIHDNADLIK